MYTYITVKIYKHFVIKKSTILGYTNVSYVGYASSQLLKDLFMHTNVTVRRFKINMKIFLWEALLPYDPSCPSVGQSVCHNFLKEKEVSLPRFN